MASGFLASIATVILSGMAVCASGAQANEASVITAQTAKDASVSTGRGTRRPALQQRNPRYELRNGDVFDLNFHLTPEFNQTITVQPDGYIALTGVGDLHVAGKTVPELRDLLHATYAKILKDPVINVVVKDFEKPYFIAGGEVARPGKYDMRSDTTVTEAVAIAGGFTENSKHSQVLLFRRVSNDWFEVKKLNVKKMFRAADLREDLHLQAGDMLFVPQNTISKIRKYISPSSVGTYIDPTKF